MAISDYAQITALADSPVWQTRVRAAILKQAAYVLDNQANFSAPQVTQAKSIMAGLNLTNFYNALAAGSAAVASTISYDWSARQVVTDMTDAALISAVIAEVFGNLL